MVYSTFPPVSVSGTDTPSSKLRSFSGWPSLARSALAEASTSRQPSATGGCPPMACGLGLPLSNDSRASIPRPSIAPTEWYRNINLLSIDYAFRPRLRIRLTLGGRTFPRKPWDFGVRNFHPDFRYSCLHGHLRTVHGRFRSRFIPCTTLFYHPTAPRCCRVRGFGSGLESRSSSARNHSTSELLRTL